MDSQDENGEQRHGSRNLVSMLERFTVTEYSEALRGVALLPTPAVNMV
jgi:hypothetical protein